MSPYNPWPETEPFASKADFTVREVYFSNISKDTAFLLQGMLVSNISWIRKAVPFEYWKNILP